MIAPLPAGIPKTAVHAAGVSRLGDITGLDLLEVPVWQVVRPMSRSLSTHQGKGWTHESARIGALMEAFECDAAERWDGPRHRAAWARLDPACRALAPDDFARERGSLRADNALDWTPTEPIDEGEGFFVPADAVSLDYTRPPVPGLARGSNGQGAHFEPASATLKALYEIIERDAMSEFMNGSPRAFGFHRTKPPEALPSPAAELLGRCAELGIETRLHLPPALAGVTVVVCEMLERGARTCSHAFALGTGASLDPLEAFLAALLEAAQSRVTGIAGARDDLPLDPQPPRRLGLLQGPALRDFQPFPEPQQDIPGARQAIALIVERLAAGGYGHAGQVALPAPDPAIHVVKCWVPGLGQNARRRRRLATAS